MKTTGIALRYRQPCLPELILGLICVATALLLGLGGCSSDSSNSTTQPSTLEAPSVQSYTGDTFNVLDWPAVEDATGYTVYFTTDGSDPTPTAEHMLETVYAPPYLHGDFQKDGVWVTGDEPLQAGQTYRYIVTARFGEIEGPCSNCVTCVLEVPGSGTWRVEGLGNNLSTPLLFSEGRGMTGLTITNTDTGLPIFTDTGLRTPTVVKVDGDTTYTDEADIFNPEIAGEIVTEPILYADDLIPAFDTATLTFTGETGYAQGTESIWQADWVDGAATPQMVSAAWGDNLTGHQWTANQDILRVEVGLTQALPDTTMTAYDMIALFGGKYAEFFGATGTTSEVASRVVYTPHARLQIEKMDTTAGMPLPGGFDWSTIEAEIPMLYDGAVWQNYLPEYTTGDETYNFGGEINGSGNLTYGYVWDLNGQGVTPGWYRLTLRLDPLANCTQLTPEEAPAEPASETEVTLYPDLDVPVNTFLAMAPEPEAEGEGPLFPAALVVDPAYGGEDVYMSVLYIYLGPGT